MRRPWLAITASSHTFLTHGCLHNVQSRFRGRLRPCLPIRQAIHPFWHALRPHRDPHEAGPPLANGNHAERHMGCAFSWHVFWGHCVPTVTPMKWKHCWVGWGWVPCRCLQLWHVPAALGSSLVSNASSAPAQLLSWCASMVWAYAPAVRLQPLLASGSTLL